MAHVFCGSCGSNQYPEPPQHGTRRQGDALLQSARLLPPLLGGSWGSNPDYESSQKTCGSSVRHPVGGEPRTRTSGAPSRIPFRSRKTSVVAPMQQKALVLRLERRCDVRRHALPLRGRLQFGAAALPVRTHHVGGEPGRLQLFFEPAQTGPLRRFGGPQAPASVVASPERVRHRRRVIIADEVSGQRALHGCRHGDQVRLPVVALALADDLLVAERSQVASVGALPALGSHPQVHADHQNDHEGDFHDRQEQRARPSPSTAGHGCLSSAAQLSQPSASEAAAQLARIGRKAAVPAHCARSLGTRVQAEARNCAKSRVGLALARRAQKGAR